MSATWRLLGPLETANGMLLFGVSAAMIFAVIQRLVEARYAEFASSERRVGGRVKSKRIAVKTANAASETKAGV